MKQEKQDTIYITGTPNTCPFCPLILIFGVQKLNHPNYPIKPYKIFAVKTMLKNK